MSERSRRKIPLIRATAACLILLAATGCATFDFTRTPFDTDTVLDAGLARLRGSHIDALAEIFGEGSVAGRGQRVWRLSENVAYSAPETICHTRPGRYLSIGGERRYVVPPIECETHYMPSIRQHFCEITIDVDEAGRITDHRFRGNTEGCERFAAHFRQPAFESCVESLEGRAFFGLVSEEEFRRRREECERLR